MQAQAAVPATAACGYLEEMSFVCPVLLGWCLEEVTLYFTSTLLLCDTRHHCSSQRKAFRETWGLRLFFFFIKPAQISVPGFSS